MPDTITVTREELAALLRKAKEAHGVYEETRGEPDAEWPRWYATYIFQEKNAGSQELS